MHLPSFHEHLTANLHSVCKQLLFWGHFNKYTYEVWYHSSFFQYLIDVLIWDTIVCQVLVAKSQIYSYSILLRHFSVWGNHKYISGNWYCLHQIKLSLSKSCYTFWTTEWYQLYCINTKIDDSGDIVIHNYSFLWEKLSNKNNLSTILRPFYTLNYDTIHPPLS